MMAATFAISILAIGSVPSWRGEWTHGPRYLLFMLPILALLALTWADGLCLASNGLVKVAACGAVTLVLGAALWEEWHVIRLNFFTMQLIADPFENYPTDVRLFRYLNDRMEGTILADLRNHMDRLEDAELLKLARGTLPPGETKRYQQHVHGLLQQTNFYWWPPPVNDDLKPK